MQTSTTPALSNRVPGPRETSAADDAGLVGEPASPSPVFVDTSGRRRKNWRRVTIAVVAAFCGYACLLGIGFAGGPIPPAALLPIPGVPGNSPASTASPAGNAPAATGTEGSHPAKSTSAKDTTGLAPWRADGSATSTAGSARTTAGKPTSQPGATSSASGLPAPTTPTGTTVVTPSGTASSTHGPQATPPSHSHSKTH